MEYAFESAKDVLTVSVDGRMTHADYKGFREILARINADRPPLVRFDLSKVSFVDSSALGMLLIVRDAVSQQARQIALFGAAGQVQTLIKVGKLHKYFTIE